MVLSWVGKLEVGGTDPEMEHKISGQGRLENYLFNYTCNCDSLEKH